MEPLTRDATTALIGAMCARLSGFGRRFALEEVRSRGWASVTFTGARHELTFRIEGSSAETAASDFLSNLRAAEFRLRGHVLADVALVSEERHPGRVRIAIEALTVEDG
ncbi:MAG TPA: hypothetical protein VGD66_07465 [Allosphingosinicella sp.]|jgi:hypothetical protein